MAVVTIAFTLMVGNAIWKRMAGESVRPSAYR